MAIPASVANSLTVKSTSIGDWNPLLYIAKSYMVDYSFDSTYQNYPDIQIGGKPAGPY
jgi:hypothetical protein